MHILGISGFYHNSAAALIRSGQIVAAAEEERFSRKKHDACFPINAIHYCLREGRVTLDDLDFIVFYDKPLLKFDRLLETYLTFAPKGFPSFKTAMPCWIREKLFQKDVLQKKLARISAKFDYKSKLLFAEHHQSHAASAFFPSPFEEAVVLTMDGVGEWATTSLALGSANRLEMIKEIHFPHSIGLLYSAFTSYIGFKVNSGEYKVMGLAPYGEPKYKDVILQCLVDLKEDGSFRLNHSFFNYCTGLTMTNDKFHGLFGGEPRKTSDPLTQRHMDLAASVQAVIEEVILRLTRSIAKETGCKNLCLAGGVALNCVANGKVLRDQHFQRIWIQPAAGDAGGSVGAALLVYYRLLSKPRVKYVVGDGMAGSYLGPSYSQTEIEQRLYAAGACFTVIEDGLLMTKTAAALAEGKAVGWFQGRMEFGPRALGGRSILADARSPTMQRLLNMKVKYRESFRPFAPCVLREDVNQWFDLNTDSPYMLLVANVLPEQHRTLTQEERGLFGLDKLNVPRSSIPAVTHVDYSARIQTVHKDTNPRFHALLRAFKDLTGCPILVNTSFNVRGEPIVCTPEDAFRCFMGTDIDVLVVGNCMLEKKGQNENLKFDSKAAFDLD